MEIVLIGSVKTSRRWHSDQKGREVLKVKAQAASGGYSAKTTRNLPEPQKAKKPPKAGSSK